MPMIPWDDSAIETLTRMWDDGHSASEIADKIPGSTRSGICGKVRRLGLSMRKQRNLRPRRIPANRPPPKPKAVRPVPPQPKSAALHIKPEPFVPLPEIEVPLAERRQLIDLEDDNCRWPIGDTGTPDFHFCNSTKYAGLPYCENHARRAYQPPRTKPQQLSWFMAKTVFPRALEDA